MGETGCYVSLERAFDDLGLSVEVVEKLTELVVHGPVEQAAEMVASMGLPFLIQENPQTDRYNLDVFHRMPDESLRKTI